MIVLTMTFLIRSTGITIKQMGPLTTMGIIFDRSRVREFAAIISKEYREETREGI